MAHYRKRLKSSYVLSKFVIDFILIHGDFIGYFSQNLTFENHITLSFLFGRILTEIIRDESFEFLKAFKYL